MTAVVRGFPAPLRNILLAVVVISAVLVAYWWRTG